MTRALSVISAGPSVTVQDLGRTGFLAFGLSRGGAVDRLAIAEGAALLGQPVTHAALEMAGMGAVFEAHEDLRIALTGAPMRAQIDGQPLVWHASHLLPKGARLSIGPAISGVYGYLHLGGGIDSPRLLGAPSAHLTAGLGKAIKAGDTLPLAADDATRVGQVLDVADRFSGGTLRVVPSLQTGLFAQEQRDLFGSSSFVRDTRGNRMGVRMACDGPGFAVEGGLNVVSEVIVPGDIQVTGDGTPFVLLAESQTTGGYPRIGTVLPCDLPLAGQAPAGARIGFRFVDLAEAIDLERKFRLHIEGVPRQLEPLIRDPALMRDLMSYNFISGVTDGKTEA